MREGGALVWSSFPVALAGCHHQCIRWQHPRICLARCLRDMSAPSSRVMSPDEWNHTTGRIWAKASQKHTVRLHGVRLTAAGAPVPSGSAETPLLPRHVFEPRGNLFCERLGLNQFHALLWLSLCTCGSGIRITRSATRSASHPYLSPGCPTTSFI